jgi:hypothetical protein
MLQFALANGFRIYEVEPRPTLDQYRVRLVKTL